MHFARETIQASRSPIQIGLPHERQNKRSNQAHGPMHQSSHTTQSTAALGETSRIERGWIQAIADVNARQNKNKPFSGVQGASPKRVSFHSQPSLGHLSAITHSFKHTPHQGAVPSTSNPSQTHKVKWVLLPEFWTLSCLGGLSPSVQLGSCLAMGTSKTREKETQLISDWRSFSKLARPGIFLTL